MDFKYIKIDFVSLSVSAVLHIFVFLFFHVSVAFVDDEYKVVDIDTFPCDFEIETDIISLRGSSGGKDIHRDNYINCSVESMDNKNSFRGNPVSLFGGIGVDYTKYVNKASQVSQPSKKRTVKGKGNVRNKLDFTSLSTDNNDGRVEQTTDISSDRKEKLVSYILKVRNEIESAWDVSFLASDDSVKNIKDAVTVELEIDKSGLIERFVIREVSGNSVFNSSVVRAVYDALPFPSIPDELEMSKLRLRINFAVR